MARIVHVRVNHGGREGTRHGTPHGKRRARRTRKVTALTGIARSMHGVNPLKNPRTPSSFMIVRAVLPIVRYVGEDRLSPCSLLLMTSNGKAGTHTVHARARVSRTAPGERRSTGTTSLTAEASQTPGQQNLPHGQLRRVAALAHHRPHCAPTPASALATAGHAARTYSASRTRGSSRRTRASRARRWRPCPCTRPPSRAARGSG